ncbi:hypothetical protein OG884_15880 [Streptosporangium sp. NBC_01755]|uniref:hypothetical protein n=1 Tax=unclassified Streptosporangium TaxID=2632669 RepID=UPI002DD9530C|nr:MULTISPECIES: hypothetical protein [unclassified Streptosporangium]WSA25373.1 hypothetical protein OIE13_31355 [Streptosporangium sp. NBC_01810]WSD03311.1 hypothetical protein OG884_15880 [Streptosporangium sp. NBC_01755]
MPDPLAPPGAMPAPGLAAEYDYRVRIRTETGLPAMHQTRSPAWVTEALTGRVTLPGPVLVTAGVPITSS